MDQLLKGCTRMINLPPTGQTSPLYPWILWVLWTSRNQFMFEDKSFSESEMICKALKLAKEWQSAQPQHKVNSVSPKDCQPPNQYPRPLQVPQTAILIYSDAAWNSTTCDSGLGWVATDKRGAVMFQGSSSRRYAASVLVAEALALKSGLQQAVSLGYKDAVCLSDSRCLVGLLTENVSVISIQGLLHDICVLSKSLNSISFKFISRDFNSAADSSAKNALFVLSNSGCGMGNSVVG
ncbi:uncharacterized protein LOC103836696 [Brassica rapa]|uniref:uncharacterized protein LOC103836696 n=1 Tax=Brassica campestris TaxID=3711 RepID=UPI00142D48FC|nr:uncharacterized protein LOC103836696 [Brassica rapa]